MFQITSDAFKANERIPKQHTGEGEDISPKLTWTSPPAGTKELALICDDPDAPTSEPWVHWVIYNLSSTITSLGEDIAKSPSLDNPKGALQGKNSWGSIAYRGPLPPPGHGTHHYHFKLYALDKELNAKAGLDKKSLLSLMQGHVISEASLVGFYSR